VKRTGRKENTKVFPRKCDKNQIVSALKLYCRGFDERVDIASL
jgi:hypothetical protein